MNCLSCGGEIDGALGDRCDGCAGEAGTLGVGGQDLIVTRNESLPSVAGVRRPATAEPEAGLLLAVSGVVETESPATSGGAWDPSGGPVGGTDATMAAMDALDAGLAPPRVTGVEHTLAALDVLDAPATPATGDAGPQPFVGGSAAAEADGTQQTAAALSVLDGEQQSLPCFEGKYQALRVLGRGGMGLVYFGQDKVLGRSLAIKVTLPELGTHQEAKERFLREAKTLANLDHPNIVPIYSYGWEGGSHYFVMKYVEGKPLDAVTKSTPLDQRAELLISLGPVFAALQHAHDVGIVHRDIKPPNIMFANDGTPMLLDFGIARDDSAVRLTQGDRTLGTPAYMSPEAALGTREAGAASDQYGLAVVCYEMLTGSLPFRVPDPVAMLMQHLQMEPEPLDVRQPLVAPAVSAAVLRGMAKAPEDRYGSVVEFFDALRSAISPERSLAELLGAGGRLATPLPVAPPAPDGGASGPAAAAPATQPAAGLSAAAGQPSAAPRGKPSPLKWIAIAAAVVAVLGAGAWALMRTQDPGPEVPVRPARAGLEAAVTAAAPSGAQDAGASTKGPDATPPGATVGAGTGPPDVGVPTPARKPRRRRRRKPGGRIKL